jgi:hypothetical protein
MKKSFLYLVLGLTFALYSCSEDDDITSGGEIIDPEVVTNDETALSLANGALTAWKSISASVAFIYESATEGTNSFEAGEQAGGPLVSRFEIQPDNSYVGKLWRVFYQSINNANDAIDKISAIPDIASETVPKPLISTAVKNKAIGWAKFIRALSYHYLVQTYGKVPLFTHAEDAANASRASVDAVYEQIVQDLEDALKLLPATSTNKSQPSQGSANALLARVYLSWAQVGATSDQAKLTKAVEYADKVISSGEYALIDDFTKNIGRYYKNGKELIFTFSHEFGESNRDGGNHQSHCAFTFAFDFSEELHIGLSDIELYNRWDDHDQRKEYSYSSHLTHPETGEVWEYLPPVSLPPFGKGIDRSYPTGPLDSPYERDFDRNEIRYAEVLLIKAEALNELGKTTEAHVPLNQIRHRAYINEANPSVYEFKDLSQAEFRDALRTEREHEFIYESKRWTDLVRWKILIQTVKSVADFADYKEYGDNYEEAPGVLRKSLLHLHAKVQNVGIKHYLFPIPQSVLENNPNLTQNYGYDSYGHQVEEPYDSNIYK